MRHYFISPECKQFKANLHCHSNLSDGVLTPEELKAAYKTEGYSVLAVTDHEYPKSHSYLTDKDFLMLTGYEVYIRPSEKCEYNPYEPEVHLNLFAKEPQNEAYVCYNRAYCKYVKSEAERESFKKVGSMRPREYTVEYINEFIATANQNGYLVAYNHPVWSMEDEARIFQYENIFSLEIDNYGSELSNRLEHSGALYDKLLRRHKNWFCHGGDDNHNKTPLYSEKSDSFGAFTMILSDELSYPSVIEAMEKGNMYSSTGPRIYEVSLEDNTVHIACSPAKQIILHTGSKSPAFVIAENGQTFSSADLTLDKRADYFRISVIDVNGKRASTPGCFFRNLSK